MSDDISSLSLSQQSVAREAGVEVGFLVADESKSDEEHAESVVHLMETQLGQDTLLEQSRWYLLSIERHLAKAGWLDPEGSAMDHDRQYVLAAEFIAEDAAKKMLKSVLKDWRCKFTLLRFAKVRNLSAAVLSSNTKAYKSGVELLVKSLVSKPVSKSIRKPTPAAKTRESNSSSGRRAARRGFVITDVASEVDSERNADSNPAKQTAPDSASSMSQEEYDRLEQAIVSDKKVVIQRRWNYGSNEEKISLAVGLVSGLIFAGLFIFVVY